MLRTISQILLIIIFLIISFCVYLSVYGINTDKFNGIINEKISKKDSDFDIKLNKIKIKWKNRKCMTIVLCTKGYPGKYRKNLLIKNLNKVSTQKNSQIFHAGTQMINKKYFSIGGRVLNITSSGYSFLKIRKSIFKVIRKINWKYGFFRKDIGCRVI